MDAIKTIKRDRCEVQGSKLLLCDAIGSTVEVGGQGSRRQGLKAITLLNRDDRRTRQALGLISGDYRRGVQVAFCPACGVAVTTSYDEETGR